MAFKLELCQNRAGYDAHPDGQHRLDMDQAAQGLKGRGHDIIADAGMCFVAQVGPVEVTVFNTARLMIKTPNEELADAVARETWDAMGVET